MTFGILDTYIQALCTNYCKSTLFRIESWRFALCQSDYSSTKSQGSFYFFKHLAFAGHTFLLSLLDKSLRWIQTGHEALSLHSAKRKKKEYILCFTTTQTKSSVANRVQWKSQYISAININSIDHKSQCRGTLEHKGSSVLHKTPGIKWHRLVAN